MEDTIKEFIRILKPGAKLCIFDRDNNLIPRIFFLIRQPLKLIYKPKSQCSTRNEVDFLDSDLDKIVAGGFEIIRRRYVVNIFFQILVIFTNSCQYLFGHQVALNLQKSLLPFAIFLEKYFSFKPLCVEQCIVLKKK